MATPTSEQVGIPVTIITDESNGTNTAEPIIDSGDVGQGVKYVPTPGGIDDH